MRWVCSPLSAAADLAGAGDDKNGLEVRFKGLVFYGP